VTQLEVSSRDQCLAYLAAHDLGRIALTVSALPAVLPVHYQLLADSVVFRAAPRSRLVTNALGCVVAFEVDAVAVDGSGGWSVLIVGYLLEIRDEAILARARQLPLVPWAPDGQDRYLTIPIEHISGRSFGEAPPKHDQRADMIDHDGATDA